MNWDGDYQDFRGGNPEAEKWNHLALAFDGDAAHAYLNGERVATLERSADVKFTGSPNFMIGERSLVTPGEPFNGMIDEVAFFERVLSGDDIKRFMSDGVPLAVEPQGKLATSWAELKG